jgi:PAS domain-containing protein
LEGHLTADGEGEHRIVLPDGTVKYFHGIVHPVFDDAGHLVEYVGTTVDVTEHKRAEEALRRSEAYLAEAQKLSHTGSFGWDLSNGEIYWSSETFRIFEFEPTGKVTVDLILQRTHPEDRIAVQQLIERGWVEDWRHTP